MEKALDSNGGLGAFSNIEPGHETVPEPLFPGDFPQKYLSRVFASS